MDTYPPHTRYEVTLPVGHRDAAGHWHHRALLRRMLGHDEALLFEEALPPGRLVGALLEACVVGLGELPTVDAEVIADLTTADRNFLVLELRRLTLGDRLAAAYRCPSCGDTVRVLEDLATLPVRRLDSADPAAAEPTLEVHLEQGWVDRDGQRHTEVSLRLPRGHDEELVARLVPDDPLAARDAFLLGCVERFGDLAPSELSSLGLKILRELTLGDRQRLLAAFENHAPGVDFHRVLHCDGCGTAFEGTLDFGSFFLAVEDGSVCAARSSTSPGHSTGHPGRSST